jgi:methylmalonyl-CoA epimerase
VIDKIDHIGIAVKSLDDSLKFYTEILGLEVEIIEVLEERKIRTAVINIGGSKIELLESTSPDSVIAKFIDKRGEGLHHLALGTKNLEKMLDEINSKHIQLIDKKPRRGVQNTLTAFIHPSASKFLLELVEE